MEAYITWQSNELEEIGCIILELGYFIDFLETGVQDPLSAVLSLTSPISCIGKKHGEFGFDDIDIFADNMVYYVID